MGEPNVFHVAILVKDLELAIADFTELLGYTFEAPLTRQVANATVFGEPATFELRFVYSNEGPPYIELIEAHDDGVFGIQHGEGLHHIGAWQEGLEERIPALLADGHRGAFVARRSPAPDSDTAVIFLDRDHPRVHGTMIHLTVPGPVIRSFDD